MREASSGDTKLRDLQRLYATNKINRWKLVRYVFLLMLVSVGCATPNWESRASKIALPASAVIGYFGSIAIHEGGHAITGHGIGANEVDVDFLPTRDETGNLHLALTTISARKEFSKTEITLFRSMGATANFLAHLSAREILKTGKLPKILQPTIAWFGLSNQIAFYYHAISGLARDKKTDLGKEAAWISATMLAGGLAYNIWDFLIDDDTYVKVLFGEDFYEDSTDNILDISFLNYISQNKVYLGVKIEW